MLKSQSGYMTSSVALLCTVLWCSAAVAQTQADKDSTSGFQEPQDVEFIAKHDQTPQRYVLLLPSKFDDKQSHDLLIALHGHGSDRWQFVQQARPECSELRRIAADKQMIFVSPDYRAKTSWMGPAAEADLLQILESLRGKYRLRHIIISGGSMGGTSALAFAALHPDQVRGVVALNGTANMIDYEMFQDAIQASYGGTKQEKPDVYRSRSAEFFPDRFTMPVAVTTGGQDTLVPPDSVLRLVEQLKKQNRPVLSIHRPTGGHDTNAEDTSAALNFVLDSLSSKPAPNN
ncbi:MAG: alpha/beta fold hydrolase [Planctomycetaceae bacterium]|nr:alpha/beta fold hydrolase [Planctomycetaceae bacterium]